METEKDTFQLEKDGIEENVNRYEQILHTTERLESSFENFYSEKYSKIPSVEISSGIDETVRFVGSHISVMKPYIEDESRLNNGVYMVQDCIRTKNVDKLCDDEYTPLWGSYFRSMGALVPSDRIQESCDDMIHFLTEEISIPMEDLLFRVSSEDVDLLDILKNIPPENLELDTKQINYYRHKIGLEGVRGRNFNIALKNQQKGNFNDIGNFILLEDEEKKLSVETAIGISTVAQQLESLDSVMECNPIPFLDELNIETSEKRRLQDAITVSSILFQEGLRPLGSGNRNRILKKYTQAISYIRVKSNISFDEIASAIQSFNEINHMLVSSSEKNEQLTNDELIVTYLQSYEEELHTKKNLSKIDKKILEVM